jgi:UDP-xylose:glucoside alpha-1,3-xylosyltransferase
MKSNQKRNSIEIKTKPKRSSKDYFLIFVSILALFVLLQNLDRSFKIRKFKIPKFKNFGLQIEQKIVIGVVACGIMRMEETLTLVKSALIFSCDENRIKFIIFSEKPLFLMLSESLKGFQSVYEFEFELKEISYPVDNKDLWKSMFKPCASQRLFFPSLLPEVDSLLYVDSDTVFLSPPAETFNLFNKFKSTQIAGLINEAENLDSWYPNLNRIPFYGKFGLNSGVMLMNLTRMRELDWEQKMVPIYEEYKRKL